VCPRLNESLGIQYLLYINIIVYTTIRVFNDSYIMSGQTIVTFTTLFSYHMNRVYCFPRGLRVCVRVARIYIIKNGPWHNGLKHEFRVHHMPFFKLKNDWFFLPIIYRYNILTLKPAFKNN